jgi:bifunctional non-homologous end joining protein LigD
MLAVLGQPFDSDEHFFEFKWDGIRTQALIDSGGVRLMSRNGIDISVRYPEMEGLSALPRGLALDGELVAFRNGRPDFESVLGARRRKGSSSATFMVFDILYEAYESLMDLTFVERRKRLVEAVSAVECPAMRLSEGANGGGLSLYKRAGEQGLEGVVGKRLSSMYAPGRRNGAWIKVKHRSRLQAVIIGFIEKGNDFQCLLVAANGKPGLPKDSLAYVGRVGGGFNEGQRAQLNTLLRKRTRSSPLVACVERAQWIEPDYYCMVSFADWTQAGMLRAPVFEGLIKGSPDGAA